MFGKKESTMGGFASGSITVISKATEIVGDLHFSGNLEIEGTVKGNIIAEEGADARVRVMEKGRVEGEITVPTVVVNGQVVGDIHTSKHIELAAKAVIEGNVHYNLIEMVKGSQVNGNLYFVTEASKAKKSQDKPKKSPSDNKPESDKNESLNLAEAAL